MNKPVWLTWRIFVSHRVSIINDNLFANSWAKFFNSIRLPIVRVLSQQHFYTSFRWTGILLFFCQLQKKSRWRSLAYNGNIRREEDSSSDDFSIVQSVIVSRILTAVIGFSQNSAPVTKSSDKPFWWAVKVHTISAPPSSQRDELKELPLKSHTQCLKSNRMRPFRSDKD